VTSFNLRLCDTHAERLIAGGCAIDIGKVMAEAAIISSEFLVYGSVVAVTLLAVPVILKVFHVMRTQVRKILAAMEPDEDDEMSEDDNPA
jgi:hypothetical protein